MPTLMSLGRMVDLSLGTPEVGSVNFNVLHSLLRAMVNHLGIVEVKAEVSDEAEEVLKKVHGGQTTTTDGLDQRKKDSEETDESRGKEVEGKKRGKIKGETGGEGGGIGGGGTEGGGGGGGERRKSIGSTGAGRVKELEKKVEHLEQQWKELNSFPTNGELVEYMRKRTVVEEGTEGEGEVEGEGQREGQRTRRRRPVSEMWLSLQLSKKVDANTEGVTKVHLMNSSYLIFLFLSRLLPIII